MGPEDFERSLHVLLGLPFDAVSMPDVVARIGSARQLRQRLFISTPNLNFLIAARSDPAFRQSVFDSDLNLADGMPIIWIARLLGVPLPERVPGSGLIESLRLPLPQGSLPIRIFFFGGEPGLARLACERLNAERCGLICAGALDPGFGTAEELSTAEHIDTINAARPDFLIVSLGAKKGQAWIVANRSKLDAPVISHLGAVVKFVAGDVTRAPALLQKLGLEWLWRIQQEPGLWHRYWSDGLAFLGLLATRVFPLMLWIWGSKLLGRARPGPAVTGNELKSGRRLIKLGPCLTHQNINAIREVFRSLVSAREPADLDFSAVRYVDSAFLGQLQILQSISRSGVFDLRLIEISYQLRRVIYWFHCDPT